MAKPLRYIIVGTGGMGRHWCSNTMARLGRLGKTVPVAAVDIVPEALNNAKQLLGLPAKKCYTDMKRAFDENRADFAVCVTPPAFHEAVVDAALAHDMHILSEKPIADTMEACARVYKKVTAAKKKMAVTMSHRFDQDKQSLEREIKTGNYGPLNYIVGRFTMNCRKFASWGKFRHEIPDPLLVEGAVHHFDIVRALTGSDAKTVYTLGWNPEWGEYAGHSTALVTMDMVNGTKVFWEGAKCNATNLNGWGRDYFRAECRDATVELNQRWLRVLRGGGWDTPPLGRDIPLAIQEVWHNEWIAEMYVDWLNGGDPPPCTLEDNIQCAALLFAAIESDHKKKVVDVQKFLKKALAEN